MKLIISHLFFSALLFASFISSAQNVALFSENFDSNICVSSTDTCYANNYNHWTITQPTTNGAYPNRWFVSTNENGGGQQGTCGQRSNTSRNGTLHIASTVDQYNYILFNYPMLAPFFPCQTGDCGDSYFAGLGQDGSFVTDQRIESPIINTQNTCFSVFLTFNYIEDGQDSVDNMTIEYSTDNGSTWALLADPPKTDTCPTANSGDGLWSKITVQLPDSSSFIPYKNYKVGFRWVNNDDGMGHDPAIAIDSVLVYTTSAPDIGIDSIPTLCASANFILSPFYADPYYTYVWTVNGGPPFVASNPLDTVQISFPNSGTYTVSLDVSDYNSCGNTTSLDTIKVTICNSINLVSSGSENDFIISPDPVAEYLNLHFKISHPALVSVDIYNIIGQKVMSVINRQNTDTNLQNLTVNTSELINGNYFICFSVDSNVYTRKVIVSK